MYIHPIAADALTKEAWPPLEKKGSVVGQGSRCDVGKQEKKGYIPSPVAVVHRGVCCPSIALDRPQ